MESLKKRPALLTILFLILVSTIISLIVIIADSSRDRTAKLYLSVAPQDAEITLDTGTSLENNTANHIKPGSYKITISKDGYDSQVFEISFEPRETKNITTALLPQNNDFSVYETDYDNLYDLRVYSNSNSNNSAVKTFLEAYDKKSTIKDILPLFSNDSTNYYYVFYQTDMSGCKRLYCLEIGTGTDEGYNNALNDIRAHGYNPDDYQIIRT